MNCAWGSYLSKHHFVAECPDGSPLQEHSDDTDKDTSTSNNMINDGNAVASG